MLILDPVPWWPLALLALALAVDAALSLRPPAFIRDCLDGVGFPRQWWWVLIVVKTLAVVGLVVGIWLPGVAVAATVGVVAYFGCAVVAHLRARFFGSAFWVNCLGMLALSLAVLVANLAA
ncbi:DoxX family protein [Brachybacterium sacelli]|uniref:ABC-type multidrug transport system permease subunit n=1 Tax=Brachybacterium sacelli TaxID=173364 RepID=A0ABS4X6G9_9MICO|nr:DoxX family protein [Brachybacterium sacelli]MBP2384062.1 ABC-type multidrug transport system permease subunit [Brachybacterium sacelli]